MNQIKTWVSRVFFPGKSCYRRSPGRQAEGVSANEERWKFALEGARDGVWDWNLQSGEVFISSRWRAMLGYGADELRTANDAWVRRLHPEDKPGVAQALQACVAGPLDSYEQKARLKCKDGYWKWVLIRGRVQGRGPDGKALRMTGTITDLDIHERACRREAARGAVLEKLAKGTSLEELLPVLSEVFEREDEAFTSSVLLHEFGSGCLRGVEGMGLYDLILEPTLALPVAGEIHGAGKVLFQGEVFESRPEGDVLWASLAMAGARRGAALCWMEPLVSGTSRLLGILAVFRKEAAGGRLPDLGVIQQHANLVSIIVSGKRAEESLRLQSAVFRACGEGILITDGDNRILAVNPAFTQMTGYSAEEVIGRSPAMLQSGLQDEAFYRRLWTSLNETGNWQGEMWDRRKDGGLYLEAMTIQQLRDKEGRPYRHIGFFTDITERKRAEELIWRQANYDALTGLPNRSLFHERLEHDLRRCHRGTEMVALLFIDLDRFKDVNDTLGHPAGDLLLKQAGGRIAACVRESDTVARLGGDEFTVILPGVTDPAGVERVAQAVLDTLAEPFKLDDKQVYISASVGITLSPLDGGNVETLIRNADQAMYAAKEAGRSQFSFFTDSLQRAAQQHLTLANDLRRALRADQFHLELQPIVSMATGRVVKAEALLRWTHPQLGLVSPAVFIPVAEETGLIEDIGDWIFREAVGMAKRWRDIAVAIPGADTNVQISVNKSPRQFGHGPDRGVLFRSLEDAGLAAHHVVVEITEGLLLDDRPGVAETLDRYRDAGIQVALDDFGTGYSALSYLKRFDIDYLKVDRAFVRDIESDASDQAIVEAIILMAHKLGLKVVAEGVETDGQRRMLMDAGCDFAQGYYFARPMPFEDFEQKIRQELAMGQSVAQASGGIRRRELPAGWQVARSA